MQNLYVIRSLKGDMTGKSKSVRLWHEIALTLVLKGILLAIIWNVWFSSPEGRSLDASKVASQIFSTQSQKVTDHDAVPRAR
jgi:hypothetical protein